MNPSYQYRPLLSTDIVFLKDMLYQSLFVPPQASTFPRSIIEEPYLSKYHEDWGRESDEGILVKKDDVAIGAVWCRLFKASNPGYGFVDATTPELGIALVESYRNQGIGQILLSKMIDRLAKKGVKKVSLSVDKRNRAVALYQRNGFNTWKKEGMSLTLLKTIHPLSTKS